MLAFLLLESPVGVAVKLRPVHKLHRRRAEEKDHRLVVQARDKPDWRADRVVDLGRACVQLVLQAKREAEGHAVVVIRS